MPRHQIHVSGPQIFLEIHGVATQRHHLAFGWDYRRIGRHSLDPRAEASGCNHRPARFHAAVLQLQPLASGAVGPQSFCAVTGEYLRAFAASGFQRGLSEKPIIQRSFIGPVDGSAKFTAQRRLDFARFRAAQYFRAQASPMVQRQNFVHLCLPRPIQQQIQCSILAIPNCLAG